MKKKEWRMSLQIILTFCALWGWWGMLYPEFTLTEDTYRVVYEETEDTDAGHAYPENGEAADMQNDAGAKAAEADGESPRELYRRLLHASKGQLRFRSRFLIQLQKWMEQ